MIFIETGCLGDLRQAAFDVEVASKKIMGSSFRTVQGATAGFMSFDSQVEGVNLALARMVGTKIKSGLHPVSHAPEGAVIGSMVTEGDAVVDADVSKRHARIWLDGGKWYIQDLKSTNGTYLIRGDSKAECPFAGVPVELFASDIICLGATTRFMVWDVAPQQQLAASPLPERASSEGASANVNYVDGEYGEEGDERAEGKIANVVNAAEE